MMVRGWGRMMVEYEGRMGDDGGRTREDGRMGGVNSVGIPPVRKLLPPSPADPTLFGMTVLQVLVFLFILFLRSSSCSCGSVSCWL